MILPERVKKIYDKYYTPGSEGRRVLQEHSQAVAGKVLDIVSRRNVKLDLEFAVEAALLHDIGIYRTNAPGIECHGSLPYICHGVEGRKILESEGMPRHALVCERHTGSGLTIDDIRNQGLPLPERDMLPVTIEERIVCYADKFFSKGGDLGREKQLDKVIQSMAVHGEDTLARFLELHREFGGDEESAPVQE